jgi:uncharacterized repeat protein (TIGR02543 family)
MQHKVSINEMSPALSTSAPCPDQPPSCGRKGRILSLARICAMALLLPSVADAWVINVQYGPNDDPDGHYANASMGGLTGPSADTGTTWNSFLGNLNNGRAYNGAQATNAALVDSTNHPTPVKLTFLAPEGNAIPGTGTLPIFRSCVFVNAPTLTNFVISGLSPGTLYDLYAISGGIPSGTYVGTFHVTGATVSASKTSTNTAPFTAFNSGNALLFADLAPTADGKLTLTMDGGSYPTSNGFQLVEHTSSYTLTYDANGGTGAQSDSSSPYVSGTTVTVLGAGTMAQTGYTFTGWNTVAIGGGASYAPGETFSITANTTLYAQWSLNTYTLSYSTDVNGSISSGNANQTGIPYNGSGTAVTALANTGYHFVNWDDSSTANPRTDSAVTADLSFTANFAINTYTLTYSTDANGSISSGNATQTGVPYNGSGTAVTALANTGYHFVNWSDSSTANPRTDSTVTADLSFTANFAINTYTDWAISNSVTGGPNGDSDNDGIRNLVEYALALNPGASDGSAGTLTSHLLSFNKRAEAVANGDVTYTIETSTNLQDSVTSGDGGWAPVTPDTNNGSIISYTLPVADKAFARLRVRTLP